MSYENLRLLQIWFDNKIFKKENSSFLQTEEKGSLNNGPKIIGLYMFFKEWGN